MPYWKKYEVGSPPTTFGPATPFSVARLGLTLVASLVVAVGGTFVQYGLVGLGVCPAWQTSVAPAGAAESAMTPAAARAPRGNSRVRCEYLVM